MVYSPSDIVVKPLVKGHCGVCIPVFGTLVPPENEGAKPFYVFIQPICYCRMIMRGNLSHA
jgi:hypothetical protein